MAMASARNSASTRARPADRPSEPRDRASSASWRTASKFFANRSNNTSSSCSSIVAPALSHRPEKAMVSQRRGLRREIISRAGAPAAAGQSHLGPGASCRSPAPADCVASWRWRIVSHPAAGGSCHISASADCAGECRKGRLPHAPGQCAPLPACPSSAAARHDGSVSRVGPRRGQHGRGPSPRRPVAARLAAPHRKSDAPGRKQAGGRSSWCKFAAWGHRSASRSPAWT